MQVTLLFLRFVYIAKAENVGDKFYLEDTENNCNYNLVALIQICVISFSFISTTLYPSVAHSKNILPAHPLCPMRGRDHYNFKTNSETNMI